MTDEAKAEVKVGDMIGGSYRRVVAVADAGYYVAPLSGSNGQPRYELTKFVRTS